MLIKKTKLLKTWKEQTQRVKRPKRRMLRNKMTRAAMEIWKWLMTICTTTSTSLRSVIPIEHGDNDMF